MQFNSRETLMPLVKGESIDTNRQCAVGREADGVGFESQTNLDKRLMYFQMKLCRYLKGTRGHGTVARTP